MKLRAENMIKKYRSRMVVKGVSVEVNQGEIVGLLGPNGAGKTTSFYMMVGLIKPNGGKVFLDAQDITDLPMYKRAQMGVGYLAQEASVFRKLSVEDNILAVLEMTDLSKEAQTTKLEALWMSLVCSIFVRVEVICFLAVSVEELKLHVLWLLTLCLFCWMSPLQA